MPVIEACKMLGFTERYMPAEPREQRASLTPFCRALGHELETMPERSARVGRDLGYHDHDWELKVAADGMDGLALLFDAV